MIDNRIIVYKEKEEMRIDVFLFSHLNLSRSKIQKYIDLKSILVNDNKIKKNYILKYNDRISINIIEKDFKLKPNDRPIDIVYEDRDLIIINKERNMVVYPGAGKEQESVVASLLYLDKELYPKDNIRPGIIHRIDKDTTGLLILTKTKIAYEFLKDEIKNKNVKRYYKALIHNSSKWENKVVKNYLERDTKNRLIYTVSNKGREAITEFNLIKNFKNYSFVEAELKTGRTHQIRAHCKFMNQAIVGDKDYFNNKKAKYNRFGQFLHAYKLTFKHPRTKKELTIKTELPKEFSDILIRLE